MNNTFETDALDYLLDEMEEGRRSVFEEQLTRYWAASAALRAQADLLGALRKQALELPFFADFAYAELTGVTLMPGPLAHWTSFFRRAGMKLQQLVAHHD